MTEVTAAIIVRENRFLICQRPKGKNCELLWEFPGGKTEAGESPEQCVVRECREELGVTLRVTRKLTDLVFSYPDRDVHLHFFIAEIAEGELQRREHNAFAWISADQIGQYEFCPADAAMLRDHAAELCRQ